jgi:NitT/TauT family transport system ATP-binding protein
MTYMTPAFKLPEQVAPTPAIEFDRVSISFGGREIVEPTSLAIAAGEFVCIIGPSGCGKTTLLRAAGGLLKPSGGTVKLHGKPVTGPSSEVAIVFQDYGRALLPWRTAAGNIALALEADRVPRKEHADIVASLLRKVGLEAHADKFPSQMSGGMQQRLQIARCLAQKPSVLVMDEPFGALDAMTRQSLQDEVARLVDEQGITAIFVTHDIEEALYLADRVLALRPNPGRVADVIDVPLARPRNQIRTREDSEFLRLRRELYQLIEEVHA